MKYFELQFEDNIAVIYFNAKDKTMNTLSDSAWLELDSLVNRVVSEKNIVGAVITSGKKNAFCAGADLDEMTLRAGISPTDSSETDALVKQFTIPNNVARRIETCGKPFAAAINGLALGGGFELALACHHRIVSNDCSIKLGLPETTIGLIPGAGGTQRVTRLLGVERAVPFIANGRPVAPEEALTLGLIDEVVEPGQELESACKWIWEKGNSVAPWDKPDFSIPGGTPSGKDDDKFASTFNFINNKSGGNYPSLDNLLSAIIQGSQVPMDQALNIETQYFVDTLQSTQAKSMIRTQFFSYPGLRRVNKLDSWKTESVAVLGAGMMGAGIAFSLAKSGIKTILLDVSDEAAARGKAYSQNVVDKLLAKGLMTREESVRLIERIVPTGDYSQISNCDVVIETVFEDESIKADATMRALEYVDSNILFATNTSTIPIKRLAKSHIQPERFVGMHFHSPVDRMELIEIVVGEKTSEETVSQALAFARRIGKTAIIAQDSPFFYTSRVVDTYFREGMEMLVDGFPPELIDQAGRSIGMPRGPLELADDVAIDLIDKIATQRIKILGEAATRRRSDDVVDKMIAEARYGAKVKKGFFDYPQGSPKVYWPKLSELWPVAIERNNPEVLDELKKRLLYRQSIEASRCLDEAVLADPRSADVGAILAWSFPRWTGGPISYIEQIGITRFVAECDELTKKWGDRFSPPGTLRTLAEDKKNYYV